jgi:hypothetical protein
VEEITDLDLLRQARALRIKLLTELGREDEIADLDPIEPADEVRGA